jgi:hypothetical protein
MLQLFSYWHCNCYTPSFAICTLFAITHSALFLQPLTQTNLQSHVVKPSCNLFSYWHCNCYTPSFAICTLFCNHTFSTFFATTHTDHFAITCCQT